MKGVILAGGTGSRLYPLTKVHNKATLPVGNKPMIYYSVEKLINVGITQIVIITGKEHSGDIINLLGSGAEFGCQFFYVVQEEPNGIPSAIWLTRDIIGDDKFFVLLSDNIFDDPLPLEIVEEEPTGCIVFLAKVTDPSRFGVPKFDEAEEIVEIVEKPMLPPSDYAVTGIYYFDSYIWNIIPQLKPSRRLETEIVDVFNEYIKRGMLRHHFLEGAWVDAGTFESYHWANQLVIQKVII